MSNKISLPEMDDEEEDINYELIGFEDINTMELSLEAKKSSKDLMTKVYDYFIQNDKGNAKEYLEAKRNIEVSNLASLIEQKNILQKTIRNYLKMVFFKPDNISYVDLILRMQSGIINFQKEINILITRIIDQLQEIKTIEAEVVETNIKNQTQKSIQENINSNTGGGMVQMGTESLLKNIMEQKKKMMDADKNKRQEEKNSKDKKKML